MLPSRVQKALSKDAAPFRVGGKLDFINCEEGDLSFQRHRLDCTDPIARAFGDDFFFPSDKGNKALVLAVDHFVIDLTGQKTQRQPDHACRVSAHTIKRVMGFPGIGGTQHCSNRFLDHKV